MTAISIKDKKDFTKKLFLQDTFDSFEVSKVDIMTYCLFSIDGALQTSYYDEEKQKALQEEGRRLCLWEDLRPFCFSLIRGKKTPQAFKVILQLTQTQLKQEVFQPLTEIKEEVSYILILSFSEGSLTCTTGTYRKSFSLDLTPDRLWDQTATRYLSLLGFDHQEAS